MFDDAQAEPPTKLACDLGTTLSNTEPKCHLQNLRCKVAIKESVWCYFKDTGERCTEPWTAKTMLELVAIGGMEDTDMFPVQAVLAATDVSIAAALTKELSPRLREQQPKAVVRGLVWAETGLRAPIASLQCRGRARRRGLQ